MKKKFAAACALILLPGLVCAFDTKKASTERFKISYVEPKELPSITALPAWFRNRDREIANEKVQEKSESKADVLKMRKLLFEDCLFPIRATDQVTGIIYEVQEDRRTITATKPDGTLIWKVNPFVDAGLQPYRVPHPVIVYVGGKEGTGPKTGPSLGIGFNSSQFGRLDLATGKFTFEGQD